MDRDNARDTRSPSNRDVRLRRRTGLGGALVTGRALRRRSLNALSTRARHVHRHRQSSFAPSSPPFHHPSPPLARIRGAGRDRAIDPSSTPPVDVTPRASTPRTPREFKKNLFPRIHRSASSSPRARRPSRARSPCTTTTTARHPARARIPSVPPRVRSRARRTHPLRTGTAVNDGQRAARDARRGGRRSRRHGRADDGGSHGEPVHREGRRTNASACAGTSRRASG